MRAVSFDVSQNALAGRWLIILQVPVGDTHSRVSRLYSVRQSALDLPAQRIGPTHFLVQHCPGSASGESSAAMWSRNNSWPAAFRTWWQCPSAAVGVTKPGLRRPNLSKPSSQMCIRSHSDSMSSCAAETVRECRRRKIPEACA